MAFGCIGWSSGDGGVGFVGVRGGYFEFGVGWFGVGCGDGELGVGVVEVGWVGVVVGWFADRRDCYWDWVFRVELLGVVGGLEVVVGWDGCRDFVGFGVDYREHVLYGYGWLICDVLYLLLVLLVFLL